ncbi:hypothetical protein CR203_14335 [Salipaludibacillus neizhouensis]|uniref:Uncharacterized protein n=1 Tax=Salipaludibacillus neizhouensis TaxID=885475 RepID=A0A3A9KP38_9BACI|nr:hypothetical protein [Salipaludibacillus neizhouensis]RKL66476.1 hypothetical protein CR203_14335 [Salipaludibacillus neizhouensis]
MKVLAKEMQAHYKIEIVATLRKLGNFNQEKALKIYNDYQEPIKNLNSYLSPEDVAEQVYDNYLDRVTAEEWISHLEWLNSDDDEGFVSFRSENKEIKRGKTGTGRVLVVSASNIKKTNYVDEVPKVAWSKETKKTVTPRRVMVGKTSNDKSFRGVTGKRFTQKK